MPVPYILDPFQRIIAFGRTLLSYAYRASACPSGQGGASYERQTTTTTIATTGTQTTTVGPWEAYGGTCTPNTAPVELYLQPNSTYQFGTENTAQWDYSGGRKEWSEGVNVRLKAQGWVIPGLPAYQQPSMPLVYCEVSINGTVIANSSFSTNRFYSLTPIPNTLNFPLIGAFNQGSENTQAVAALSPLNPAPNNTYRPIGNFTVYQYPENSSSNVAGYFSVTQGTIYTFSCKITCPAYNYSAKYVYNQMIWG